MTKITREVWIDAPKDQVWEVLADFGNIYRFNPTVPNSHSTSEQTSGLGATRHCDFGGSGSSIEERIIEWKEGESMTIDIYEGVKTPPFKTAGATLSVKENKGGTLVSGTMAYELKFGPVGGLMDSMMVRSQFEKAWTGVLAGLKSYVETGEQVESPKGLNFEPVVALA